MTIFQERQRDQAALAPSEDALAERPEFGPQQSQSNSTVAAQAAQARADRERGGEAESAKPRKAVSGAAMGRINQAQEAIDHAKEVFEFGAGNQKSALLDSKMNSYYRLKAVRESSFWTLTDSVKALAAQNPEALAAAKCDMAQGGNCGEHAKVAFDYLRATAVGETISRSSLSGFDHAFVIMGDQSSDSDSELVISDPWPTAPTACLWEDHFAHAGRERIDNYSTVVADGKNIKDVIKAGLSLSAAGRAFTLKTDSKRKTKKTVKKGLGGWVWDHQESVEDDHDFDYYTTEEDESGTAENGE